MGPQASSGVAAGSRPGRGVSRAVSSAGRRPTGGRTGGHRRRADRPQRGQPPHRPVRQAKLPTELLDLVDPLRDRLCAALVDLPIQLTHGDCNVGNVLVHDGEVTGYIDLDHLPYGPRVRDLSLYLGSRLRDQIADGDPDAAAAVLRHYVAGYHSVHPLTEREQAAVVPLLLTTLIGGAAWNLHGWVPDPAAYQQNLRAIRWITSRYDHLVHASASR
ncbi:phosphotransferase [Actinopolymorpha sp. NPDC004070]|uniref:phosphotransferase enzyme family protein n=1 Tax=Actinopolymorpha sp. NPDC004070 TaxID=3154548 RepID=UPI0033A36ADD